MSSFQQHDDLPEVGHTSTLNFSDFQIKQSSSQANNGSSRWDEKSQSQISLEFSALDLEIPPCCDMAFMRLSNDFEPQFGIDDPFQSYNFGFPAFCCGCNSVPKLDRNDTSQTAPEIHLKVNDSPLDDDGLSSSSRSLSIAATPEVQTPTETSSLRSPSPEPTEGTCVSKPWCVIPSELGGDNISRGSVHLPLDVEPEIPVISPVKSPPILRDRILKPLQAAMHAPNLQFSLSIRQRQRKCRKEKSIVARKDGKRAPLSRVGPIKCIYKGCYQGFHDLSSRNRHILFKHMELGPQCPGCRKHFSRDDALKRHLDRQRASSICRIEAERLGWAVDKHGSTTRLAGRPRKKRSEIVAECTT